jgi:hypothetical protein
MLCSALLVFATGCGSTSKPTDEAIVTGIQGKMFSEPALKASSITVAAKDGVVTLSGQVPDEAARQAAEKIASDATGVSKIIDQTTLATQQASATPTPMMEEKSRAAEPKPARATSPPARRSSSSRTDTSSSEAPRPPVTSRDTMPAAAPAATPEPGPLSKTPSNTPAAPVPPPPPPKPQPVTVTIPEGAILTVRTIDPIDSTVNRTGQTFKASLDAPIVVDDRVVAPKDLNVTLKLVNASTAGRMSGRSELTVSLESFVYQGKKYLVASSDVQEKGGSRGKRSAAVIGGGAVLGAIIGGIAGGGKGAAIGAAAGGGGGAAVQALTKGEQVKIPAETRLDFTLHAPIEVTYIPVKKAPRPNPDAAPQDGSAPASSPTPGAEAPPASSDQPPKA